MMPTPCRVVVFDLPDDDDQDDLAEALDKWNLNLFDDGQQHALSMAAPMARFRKRRGYVSDRAAWTFTNHEVARLGGWFYPRCRVPGASVVSSSMGMAVLSDDREAALAALADCVLGSKLVWHLWLVESGDIKMLARAVLDGDDKAFPILADALEEAGHPLALVARPSEEGVMAFPMKDRPMTLGLSPDGSHCLVQRLGGSLSRVSMRDGKTIRGCKLEEPELAASGIRQEIAASTCGRWFAASNGPTFAAWRVRPWELLWKMEQAHARRAGRPEFAGSWVGSFCMDSVFRVWDILAGDLVGELPLPRHAQPLNLTEAGWAVSKDGKLGLWHPGGSRISWTTLPKGCERFLGLVSPDGSRLAAQALAGKGDRIILVDVPGKRIIASNVVSASHRPWAWAADGSRFFSSSNETDTAWDGRTGKMLSSHQSRGSLLCKVANADGSVFAGWSPKDVLHGYRVAVPSGPVPVEADLRCDIDALSIEGKEVAAILRRDETVETWRTDGRRKASLPVPNLSLAVRCDGGFLCGGDKLELFRGGLAWEADFKSRLDPVTRGIIGRLPAGEGPVRAVAWAEGRLAAGGWNRKLRLWRMG